MNLFNQTEIPSSVLEPILLESGNLIGSKTEKVVVLVRSPRYLHRAFGTTYNYHSVQNTRLLRKSNKEIPKKKYYTHGGWIHFRFPSRMSNLYSCSNGPRMVVDWIWHVCLHEWAHIKDLQNGGPRCLAWGTSDIPWKQRPEELRAELYVSEILVKTELGDLPDPSPILDPLVWWYKNTGG